MLSAFLLIYMYIMFVYRSIIIAISCSVACLCHDSLQNVPLLHACMYSSVTDLIALTF